MTRARMAVALAAGLLAACGRHAIFPETEEYLVGSGDTVYSVAWEQGVDYRELARWNRLRPPYRIYPGQRLVLHPFGGGYDGYEPEPEPRKPPPKAGAQVATIPMGERRPLESRSVEVTESPRAEPQAPPAQAAVEAEPATRPPIPVVPAPAPAPAPPPAPAAEPPPAQHVAFAGPWGWPAEGERVKPQSPARKGIDIHGKLGQPVHAARAGRVVYAGTGLKGYGLLTIVKHDQSYLSAYAHNDRLLVREGDEVMAGQQIAAMGLGPENLPLLYFEVRRNGKPISPYEVLPKN